MKNTINNDSAEEIVIVASCYEGLSDVIKPLCEKGEPIEREELVKLIGGEEVFLNPRDNKYDAFAVGVYTVTQKLLGYVWMQQAPSVRRWMAENGKSFVAVKIDRFNTKTGLMMAKPTKPMHLERVTRSEGINEDWAKDLPLVITDIKQQGLEMGLFVLKEKLEVLTEWDDSLKPMLDNVFRYLETDLSDYCYGECIDVYKAMRKSPIEVIREKADWFLKALVNRGSGDRTRWWIDEWLPNFRKEAKGSDLLGVYENSGYSLEMVEELLKDAPMHLYQMYCSNKSRFAKQLYYSALPPQIFYRLITLLTVREGLRDENENHNQRLSVKGQKAKVEGDVELFHFIHPEIEDEEALHIHVAMKRIVVHQKVTEICEYLKDLKKRGKVILPASPATMYNELKRMGMPTGEGYTEKHFRNYYLR